MVRFLSMFLFGWLLSDVMRGSMNHFTPVVVPVVLVCIAFTLANTACTRRRAGVGKKRTGKAAPRG